MGEGEVGIDLKGDNNESELKLGGGGKSRGEKMRPRMAGKI